MNDFPRMVYKFPATTESRADLQDGSYDTLIVEDDSSLAAAEAGGYFLDHGKARAAHELLDTKPAKRSELEAKAIELEIKFDGRTSDKKLGDMISAALE